MRREFGLPLPERRIGLAAHDFAQAFSAPEVWLTRAEPGRGHADGALALAAAPRERLQMAPGRSASARGATADQPRRATGQARPRPRRTRVPAVDPPEPRPPVEARPRRLSVTQIETWMRDPYAIYARHILRLQPLEPDRRRPERRRARHLHPRGAGGLSSRPTRTPARRCRRRLARRSAARPSAPLLDQPASAPSGGRASSGSRAGSSRRAGPPAGARRQRHRGSAAALTIERAAGALRAHRQGRPHRPPGRRRLAIIDYKTGAPPSEKEIEAGFAPQLPLEAAIAAAGGFDGVAGGRGVELAYWRLSGGEPAGEIKALKPPTRERWPSDALAGLRAPGRTSSTIPSHALSVPAVAGRRRRVQRLRAPRPGQGMVGGAGATTWRRAD